LTGAAGKLHVSAILAGSRNSARPRIVVLFGWLLALCALALLAGGYVGREAGNAAQVAAKPTCAGSLQSKIDAAAPGDTVDLARGCVYREMVTVDKPLVLRGAGEGEIRGSDVWENWSRAGATWRSSKSVPRLSVPSNYRCEGVSRRCRWPENCSVTAHEEGIRLEGRD